MVSDSLNPYEIDEEESLDYTFITKDGIKYHASFYSVEPLYPEFVDTYSFSIEPEDKRSHPMDRRIAITIAEILKRFFAVNTNAMIMVCDSTDGKEFKRRKLFDRWFEHFSDNSILKYDASAPLSEYQLFISLYISKNNPNREKLLHAFSKLMENDLYGLGI